MGWGATTDSVASARITRPMRSVQTRDCNTRKVASDGERLAVARVREMACRTPKPTALMVAKFPPYKVESVHGNNATLRRILLSVWAIFLGMEPESGCPERKPHFFLSALRQKEWMLRGKMENGQMSVVVATERLDAFPTVVIGGCRFLANE